MTIMFSIGDEVRWRWGLDWLRGKIKDIRLERDGTYAVGVLCETGSVCDVLDPKHDLRKGSPWNAASDPDVGCGSNPRMARWYKPDCGSCWDCSMKAKAAGNDEEAAAINARRLSYQDAEDLAAGIW